LALKTLATGMLYCACNKLKFIRNICFKQTDKTIIHWLLMKSCIRRGQEVLLRISEGHHNIHIFT